MFNVTVRRTVTGLAIAAAIVPAAASARLAPDSSLAVTASSTGGATRVAAVQPPATPAPGGFQWGDAGIGAGAVLVLLGAGGAATVLGRRRRPGHARAAIG